jgi:hypothetical protein
MTGSLIRNGEEIIVVEQGGGPPEAPEGLVMSGRRSAPTTPSNQKGTYDQ